MELVFALVLTLALALKQVWADFQAKWKTFVEY
jgi:hypothetical protein